VDFADIFGGGGGGGMGGFGGMSLDDILEMLGGGRATRKSRRRPSPSKGADLEYPITLDFLQAARGVRTTVRIRREGPADETIEVKIPSGVGEGQRIRVRGKGQLGPGGQGDLYIVIHVEPHPYFTRQGNDVYVDVPISMTEAALGAKVDVPTIDGMTTVTIPPGTSGGQKLRLKGRGLSAGEGRGDQYVRLKVVVPKELSARGRELLEQLQQTETADPRATAPWRT